MPFVWKKRRNFYYLSSFGILRLGPFARSIQIVDQARELGKEIRSGRGLEIRGVEINEHMLGDASRRLRQPKERAEELLLIHEQTRTDRRRRKRLIKELRTVSELPDDDASLRLRHPLALFWFTPLPGKGAVECPSLEEFNVPAADDPEELEADIVFAE